MEKSSELVMKIAYRTETANVQRNEYLFGIAKAVTAKLRETKRVDM